ncbi:hypothetical protein EHLJMEHL_00960 [Vreelandella titanicae]
MPSYLCSFYWRGLCSGQLRVKGKSVKGLFEIMEGNKVSFYHKQRLALLHFAISLSRER